MARTRTGSTKIHGNKFDRARLRPDGGLAEPVQAVSGSHRRWGVYVRISEDSEGTGLGVKRQLQDCRKKIAELGGVEIDVYDDNDKSAYRRGRRPHFERMLEDIRSGRINAVIFWKVDRLSRDNLKSAEFADLVESMGCELANIHGSLDLGTSTGRFMFMMECLIAQKASDDASDRIKRKMQELREHGRSTGGGRFYGWTLGCDVPGCLHEHPAMKINPDEAQVIRDCSRRVLAGESINSITRSLNDAGVPTRRGGPWDRKAVRNILLRARNAGLIERRALNGDMEIVGPAADWEAVVDEETWRSVCVILQDSSRRQHYTTNKVRNLLSAIATCGGCGDIMIAGTAKSNYTLVDGTKRQSSRRIYKCRSAQHGCTARNKEPIDALVTEAVLARIEASDPADLLRAHLDDEQVELETQIASIKNQMEQLALAVADEAMTLGQFRTSNRRLLERLQALELLREPVRQEQVLRDFINGESVRMTWDALGIDRQRAVIRSLVAAVVVKPVGRGKANVGFDPRTVDLAWR